MRIIIISLVLVLFTISLKAQYGKFNGMGNASVSLFDVWGVNNNQAGLAKLEESQLSALYEDKYHVKETATQAFAYVLHTKSGNFALSYNHFGYSEYSEHIGGLAFARELGKYLSLGVQFDYYHYDQTADYGDKGVALIEIGLIAEPIENFFIGVHTFNPSQSQLADYQDERVETNFRFGISYYFTEGVLVAVETAKGIDSDAKFKAGIEYEPIEHLYFRTGLATGPTQYTFGMGYTFEHFTFDLGFATHPQLPVSSQLSLTYSF